MGIINLSREEKRAISAIDQANLNKIIDRVISTGQADELYELQLSSCGPYVAEKYRILQQDLFDLARAKSSRKREEAHESVWRSAHRLSDAVTEMRHRMETEEKEDQFFRVDDHIMPPITPRPNIRFSVRYKWRKGVDDEWNHGSIEFTHTVVIRPDYSAPVRKRKPSAREQREQQERAYFDAWERVTRDALHYVHEYLQKGNDPHLIPASFAVKVGTSGYLDNFSTKFWNDNP